MFMWVHTANDAEQEKKLVALWEIFKRNHHKMTNDTRQTKHNDFQDAYDENEAPLPDIININTADSTTLVRLKGIGPATAHRIMLYRKTKGPFTNVDQLLEVSHLTRETFILLKPHLSINPGNNEFSY